MRKLLAVCLVTLSLGGCAQLQSLTDIIKIGTASVANPVTKTRLNQMEAALKAVVAGLEVWKTSCVQGVIPPVCKDQIGAVQQYTRMIPPYLTQLRTFVKTNDQVNATVVWNNLASIISTVKSQAAASGIVVGG